MYLPPGMILRLFYIKALKIEDSVHFILLTNVLASYCMYSYTSIPKKFVPNKNGYVGMAVVWLTVPTLLPKSLNVAMHYVN